MNVPDPHVPLAPTAPSPMERLFPTLTSAQIARIAARGRRRRIARGEVLVEVGDTDVPFFVVIGGEVQALRPSRATEILIVAHGPGQFSGEAIMITGRRAMGRLRASEPGEVTPDDLAAAGWPLTRLPYLLETSRPGIFAVGDVRAGNIKRVASAVGEGSIAVAFVHQVLQA